MSVIGLTQPYKTGISNITQLLHYFMLITSRRRGISNITQVVRNQFIEKKKAQKKKEEA